MISLRVTPTPPSVGYVRAVLRDDLAVLPEPVREEVALVATELLGPENYIDRPAPIMGAEDFSYV